MRAALLLVLLLGACAEKPDVVKPDPPPTVIQVPVKVYVPVDKKYTKRCSWVKSGDLRDIIEITRGRKYCLEFYENNLDLIEALEGEPAPTK